MNFKGIEHNFWVESTTKKKKKQENIIVKPIYL